MKMFLQKKSLIFYQTRKNNERKVKDPNYSNYELLQNSDKSEDSQKQSNENIIRRKKNIRNHNLFLKKDQLIKYSYRIF